MSTSPSSGGQKGCIDAEKIIGLFAPNGPFSQQLKGFEVRHQQLKMIRAVVNAYNSSSIALIEAGTGTGKSLSYLLPAIIYSQQFNERTLISTNTINLQEQLLNKDIPLITRILGINFKAVLVKGMGNYICLRKINEALFEKSIMAAKDAEDLDAISLWSQNTHDGSRSSLPIMPSSYLWERVCAENDTCNKEQCEFFRSCHFFNARKEAQDAQLLIVNHHMLFADLSVRADNDNWKNSAILPSYSHVIIDEAHNIEDIATDYLANKVSTLDLLRTLGRLSAEKSGKGIGKLSFIKEQVDKILGFKVSHDVASIQRRLSIELPHAKQEVVNHIVSAFNYLGQSVQKLNGFNDSVVDDAEQTVNTLRLLKSHENSSWWQNAVIPSANLLLDSLRKYCQSLLSLEDDLKALSHEQLNDSTKGARFEMMALINRLLNTISILESFLKTIDDAKRVKWIESQHLKATENVKIVDAELDIAKALANNLFSKFKTIVLCSATLTTDKKFDFIRRRFGLIDSYLSELSINEEVLESPFDYKKQAVIAVPTNMPAPQHANFVDNAVKAIWNILCASNGNAFVLFTSYSFLKTCYERLYHDMVENKFAPLKQGDDSRQALLDRFKSKNRSVLFGTDSFWEGVDVAGEALRCVIITKLPFQVPSEPIVEARTEAIIQRGGSAFFEYAIPNAIVKFKQGFGRLIRNVNDRGCVVCLDSRLIHKGYGQLFLNSLPDCERLFVPLEQLKPALSDFFRRTYYFTKK